MLGASSYTKVGYLNLWRCGSQIKVLRLPLYIISFKNKILINHQARSYNTHCPWPVNKCCPNAFTDYDSIVTCFKFTTYIYYTEFELLDFNAYTASGGFKFSNCKSNIYVRKLCRRVILVAQAVPPLPLLALKGIWKSYIQWSVPALLQQLGDRKSIWQ